MNQPAQVVIFAPGRNRPVPSATVVRVEKGKVVAVLASRKEMVLNLGRPDFFDVARPRQIEVSPGDKILIRSNDKRLGLTNGAVLTVSSIAPDGGLQTSEGHRVPADFRQWCHGYVVTSRRPDALEHRADAGNDMVLPLDPGKQLGFEAVHCCGKREASSCKIRDCARSFPVRRMS